MRARENTRGLRRQSLEAAARHLAARHRGSQRRRYEDGATSDGQAQGRAHALADSRGGARGREVLASGPLALPEAAIHVAFPH